MPSWLATACFGAWMALLTATHYALPSGQAIVWGALGVSAVAAIVAGVRRHGPRLRAPWFLLAGAVFTATTAEVGYRLLGEPTGAAAAGTAPADAGYFLMYPLLSAGLLLFVRCSGGAHDHGGLLDTLTLTGGLASAFLLLLLAQDPGAGGPAGLTGATGRVLAVGQPVANVLCLVIIVRLLTIVRRRSVAVYLISFGIGALSAADLSYGWATRQPGWHPVGGGNDLAWACFFALCGAAALHPSMTGLTAPAHARVSELSGGRLTLLGAASLLAPAVLLAEHLIFGAVRDALAIAVLSAVMFSLVLSRLWAVVVSHRYAMSRERALREASATLVSAADAEQVGTAVRSALTHLLPSGVDHAVVLADPPEGDQSGAAQAELVDTADLPPGIAAELSGHPTAIRCALRLSRTGTGQQDAGIVYVAAPAWALLALADVLEVLASQAALALERIVLTQEVNRRDSEAYFRTLILNTSDVILIVGADDLIRYASPSAATVLGTDALAAVPVADVMQPGDRLRLTHVLAQARAGLGRHDGLDFRAVGADGQAVAVELSCHDLRDDHTVAGLVLTLRDVTERRKLEHELTHQAFHDSLTGLANRVLFADRVEHAVTRSARERSVLGVLFIDLDDFKVVNDTLGHGVGDQLLVAVAERLSTTLRPHDTAARLGGDEFAALIEDVRHPGDVEQIAERVLAALAEPFTVDGEVVQGVASIGITTNAEAGTAEELLRQADLALYVAKGGGKNQWRRYQADLHTALVERLELRAALDHAVHDGQFLLQYQPIVNLIGGEAVGFEALVRWRHPTRGIVAPAHFIQVAEESGLIVPIGRWVLDEALTTAAQWQRMLPAGRSIYVSVNVSVRQFRAPGFVDMVRESLAAAGVPPQVLMVEITESLLLRDDEQVWVDLALLRELGVRIAIDDFGTGYSSLSYLRHMPIDVLKIDKSFIDDMVASKQQLALVSAIVRLADTLDLQVVAEGIEEQTQCDTLVDLGCPYGQGYLFSRPVSAAEAAVWLAPRSVAAA